jgi:hypothetical protein
MATTTTIRVSTDIRDLLRRLSTRRKRTAGEIVAELVHGADDDLLLADAEGGFARMATDARALAAYRSESDEIADAFEAPTPDW